MGPIKTVLYLYLSVLKVNTLKNPKPFRKFSEMGSLAVAKFLADQPDRAQAMQQATNMLQKQVDTMLSFKGSEDEAWKNYMIGSQFIDLATFIEETPMDEAVTVMRAIKNSDGDFTDPAVEEYAKKSFEYTFQKLDEQIKTLESAMKSAIQEAAAADQAASDQVATDQVAQASSLCDDDQAATDQVAQGSLPSKATSSMTSLCDDSQE